MHNYKFLLHKFAHNCKKIMCIKNAYFIIIAYIIYDLLQHKIIVPVLILLIMMGVVLLVMMQIVLVIIFIMYQLVIVRMVIVKMILVRNEVMIMIMNEMN